MKKIFQIAVKSHYSQGSLLIPDEIDNLFKEIDEINNLSYLTKNVILKKDPLRYNNYHLKKIGKYKGNYEIEIIDGYCGLSLLTNDRFKSFCIKEGIKLNFYPCIANGERKYITTLDKLLSIHSLLMAVDDDGIEVFRSDIIEYFGCNVFKQDYLEEIFLTEEMKEKLEKENFNIEFWEFPVKEVSFEKEKVQKEIEKIDIEWKKLNEEEWKIPEREKQVEKFIEAYLETHPIL